MKIAKTFICLCFSALVGAARNSVDISFLGDESQVKKHKQKCCCKEVRPGHLSERCFHAPYTRESRASGQNRHGIRHRELILGTEQSLYCCKAREECVFKVLGAKYDIPVEKINPDRESATCAISKPRNLMTQTSRFYEDFRRAVKLVQPNRVNIVIKGYFQVHDWGNAIKHARNSHLRFMLVEKPTDDRDRKFFAPEFNSSSQIEDFGQGKAQPRLDTQKTEAITTWSDTVSFRQAHVNEYSRIMITHIVNDKDFGNIFCKVPQKLGERHGIECKGLLIMRRTRYWDANVLLHKGDPYAVLTGPLVYTIDPRSTQSTRGSRRIFWASQASACSKIPEAACLRVRRKEPPIDPIRLCQQFFEMRPDAHIEAFLHICDDPRDRKDALSWGMMPGMPNGAWPDEDEDPEPNVDIKFASSDSRPPEWQLVEQQLRLAYNLDDVDDFEEDVVDIERKHPLF